MNISGIVVQTFPVHLDKVITSLNTVEGAEVHYSDQASGRIVATLEGGDIRAEVDLLKIIKTLPHVTYAEMVYHRFEGDETVYEAIPPELDAMQGLKEIVPPYFNSAAPD